jgi:hypothetical protein
MIFFILNFLNLMKNKISIVGTQGVPSNYGGFETLVDYILPDLCSNFIVTVYCSSDNINKNINVYKGAYLKYIPLSANGYQSILFDIFSIIDSIFCKNNKILILGSSGCIILPFLFPWKKKFVINIGGLDWKRSKWSYFTQKFLKLSELLGIRFSNSIISDNIGISNYIFKEYNKESIFIPYGSDHVKLLDVNYIDNYSFKYHYIPKIYFLSIARIQPDNNIELILSSFINSNNTIVFVGNWDTSNYGIQVKRKYRFFKNIILLDAIYNITELNYLRLNCYSYIHGHSAGGTNPSLLEAMQLGLCTICFSNGFNEYTTFNFSKYFSNSSDLIDIINNLTKEDIFLISQNMKNLANTKYLWSEVSSKYVNILI